MSRATHRRLPRQRKGVAMKREQHAVPLTEECGHQLAADMVREIQQHWLDREDGVPDEEISGLWRRDKSEILLRYLATVREIGSPDLARGFFAVLTDYIGSESAPSPEYYDIRARTI